MLEVCIDLRRGDAGEGAVAGSDNVVMKAGDIIVAKKSPAVWGTDERLLFLIAFLEDDALEATIPDGEIQSYPYRVLSGNRVLNQSKHRVKVGQSIEGIVQDTMFAESPGLDPTDDTSEPSSPTTKTGVRQYCLHCRACALAADVCPDCGEPMVEFLELSDLHFDDSARG